MEEKTEKWNRKKEPRDRPTQLYIVSWSLTNQQWQCSGGNMVFSTNYAGTIGHTHTKNESRHSPYTLHKNYFKLYYISKGKI